MDQEQLTGRIIGAAIKVHSRLGPGLLESAYQACLAYEMGRSGLRFRAQVPLKLVYDEVILDCGYYADFIIENQVVVELKSVKSLDFIHEAQLLSYLKLAGCPIGLLINFNTVLLRNGLRRMTNRLSPVSPLSL